ncbi:hypothetical protein [Streptomyces sp. NPDC052114]|uniref:hypothetical protein n=1 Tax=unclassified Streptomyces TaxID=2593676 RepID=UPI00342E41CC
MPSPTFLRARWRTGPAAHPQGPVLVSLTEFTARRGRLLPIALSGLRLRRAWPRLPGAVGMWLWADPLRGRSGSVSVWVDEASLHGFVAHPDHLRTVRAHRGHGTMRATVWTTEQPAPDAVWASALGLLSDPAPWPAPTKETRPS